MTEQEKTILKYLEESYSSAKMMYDEECMIRIARAMDTFKTDHNVDETEYFTQKFLNEIYSLN